MWVANGHPVGGDMTLPEEAKNMGAPPHWIAYTQVDDVDTTAKKAEGLGAKIFKEPFDIPKVGRIAVLADPQGAVFAIYKPEDTMNAVDPKKAGEFSWAELNTTDYESAWKFYSDLFGWKHKDSMDMGEGNTYFMFNDDAEYTKGGMSNMAKQMNMPPHWLHYVTVDDVEATITRIKEKGGKVVNGPMEVPGNDIIAQCQDPQGAFFAIYSEGKKS
jgi:predicted enzyme related to lactoylglutathione lyase